MTPQERKVMELALEALEGMQNAIYNIGGEHVIDLNYAVEKADVAEQTITAIKEALAQTKQEPVKYEFQVPDGTWHPFLDKTHYENTLEDGSWPIRALYTTPPQRKPLNNQNPLLVFAKECVLGAYSETELADAAFRAIEAAHGIKEKNT